MYLHNRNTGDDFFSINLLKLNIIFLDLVRKNRDRFPGGVVHSFTGTKEEL